MVSVCIATAVHLVIVFGAGRAHNWVSDAGRTRIVRRVMAAMMVGVAAWLAVSTGP
jgi:threonine/homoserine/homoserine lactone efflux protein